MIVERSMHSDWLSNAFVVADEPGGVAVFVDSGAPLEPLLEVVERERLTPTHVLRTHGHPDHVEHEDELASRFGIPVITGPLETGGLRIEAVPTPGHSDDGVAFVVNRELCFTGDTLFRDAVGGGPADVVKDSVMERLMTLPHELRALPGHTVETTIGREWERNPFVRYWRGLDPEAGGRCRVADVDGVVLVESPDYDGKGKLLVRLQGGEERIVGASRVERL
ncbi:MAG TPA: MBL fold metallo-hydrolase [Gaiella sp.]|nr:MBL fold metallo-hydrolase [Gaiella sp.]